MQGWHFSAVPIKVITDKNLSGKDVRVYAYILFRAGNKGYAWPGIHRIATELGTSKSSVKRSLESLRKNDWIRRIRRYGRSSLTFIFESRDSCLEFDVEHQLAHTRSDDQLGDELTNSSLMGRQNENKKNENKEELDRALANPSESPSPQLIGPNKKIEFIESLFYKINGFSEPDWDENPKECMIRVRKPLRRMLNLCKGDIDLMDEIMREAIIKMDDDGLILEYPLQLERVFASLLANRKRELRKKEQ